MEMNAPWLGHYDAGIPLGIGKYPDKTLVGSLADHAVTRADATAIAFKGRRLSFHELDAESDALANAFANLGIKAGDRIALLLPNCPQFLIAEFAAWKIGAIVAPQNPLYTERELEETLRTTSPEAIVVLTPFYKHVKNCQAETSIRRVIATNIKEYLPPLLKVAFTLLKEKKDGHRIELQKGDFWLQELIRSGARSPKPLTVARPDDPAVVLMSGGTTGTPKAVISTHRGLVMAGTQLSTWLREPLAAKEPSIMLPLPLFHTYGCAGAQSMTILNGIPLILVPNPRDIGDVLQTIQREKPALFCSVPTLFSAILSHPSVRRGRIDFSSIAGCFSGAAPLMAETKKRFEQLTGGRIVEGYSLTEATMACCVNPFAGTNKIGSVGLAVPDVHVKIVDADNPDHEFGSGMTGEIIMSAPQLMPGYWNNPEETANALRLRTDGTTWLHTGDLGYLDEEGFLFIVDRKKDLIKTSGFQVWPREIEEVIASHPSVMEVGVAGVPDERRGEVVHAWVVLRSEGPPVDEAQLRAFCKERLAPYKVPVHVEFRNELPKTMIGKVLRRMLVAEARERMAAAGTPAERVPVR
jgi:long-chain acyl-CoA synthetase